jgi:hypothetical protein
LFFLPVLANSCSFKEPAEFPLHDAGETVVYALSRQGVPGLVDFSASNPLVYGFDPPLTIPPGSSLELDYLLEPAASPRELVLELGDQSWLLPLDAAFLGTGLVPRRIRYAVPVPPGLLEGFSLTPGENPPEFPGQPDSSGPRGSGGPVFRLLGLRLAKRWYGYAWESPPGQSGGGELSVSPFVFYDPERDALVIDPLPRFRIGRNAELALSGIADRARITAGKLQFDYTVFWDPLSGELPAEFLLPRGIFQEDPGPVMVFAEEFPAAAALREGPDRAFPEAIPADPGVILGCDALTWRDPRYEVFRWPRFPSILIFDTADYAVQERLFKRLAFFVEKAGYRGRLMTDEEMEDLHGWNAHDYRAEDLARFFEAARQRDFPLSREEGELRSILLDSGIIRRAGGSGETGEYSAGAGAVVSISRESPEYLRSLFMCHEGFHGIFFVDEDFRDFSRRRWENLDAGAKRFIRSYFDSQRYDLEDSYLIINEFMAYCLQQPASQAGRYFGEVLAGRVYDTPWRRSSLPPPETDPGGDSPVWPGIRRSFTREAEAFSAYVNRRWGLTAGSIRQVKAGTLF